MATHTTLAVILHADVVGSTALVQKDERVAHERIQDSFWRLSETITAYGGVTHEVRGDALVAEFARTSDGVSASLAFQVANTDQNAMLADDIRPEIRVGIALGEVVIADNTVTGPGVILAQRIEQLAEPGGLCISAAIQEAVPRRLPVEIKSLGDHSVKGFDEPVRVYSVSLRAGERIPESVNDAYSNDSEAKSSTPVLALPDKPSIAVLPFDNLSGDPEQEYFADGIVDDIITALSNVQSFFVIARNSSFTYKGKAVDMKRVGRELGVHYVLEGSVRKSGSRVRVTAQLIEAASGNHIWADRFDGTPDDIFDLQDEITARVVATIQPALVRAEAKRIKQKRPENLDAYDYTLRGLSHMDLLNPEDSLKAFRLFLKAIEIDPGYARAYASACWYYRRQVQIRGMVLTEEERAEALRLAELALKSDPADPFVLYQVGLTVGLIGGNLERGLELTEQALAINSNGTRIWLTRSTLKNFLGNPEAAIESADRAIRLSPNDPSMWVAHGELSKSHIQLTDYEAALGWARRSVEKHADNLRAHHVLIASLAQLDHIDEANAALNRLLELDPGLTIERLLEIFCLSRYRNLDGMLGGLRKAGLPEK